MLRCSAELIVARVGTVRLVRRAPTNCTVPKQNSSSGNSECPRGPYSFLFRAHDFAVSMSHLAANVHRIGMNLPHSSQLVWPTMTIDNAVVAHCLLGRRLAETTFYDLFAKVRELRATAGNLVPFLDNI
ncbi:unnamed protein product [Arctia plantaginis]|uniref:Uncharacterized protein n=1 Tax=Arctia plantaginis TaxID=874455 RepID=A0A8S1AJ51_ARCPL|nr:unnamed protein product [Arctia plantaginis]CAB3260467.1 unnamed protein product [Arctia plantaginis]